MKKLFLLLFLAAPLWLYSQGFPEVDYSIPSDPYVLPTPASPSVNQLMKYVDYPATLNNGLVNIEIPLYALNVGELTIPISISYHGAGIKVAEANGRLGVGWSLNAELSVSRSGNGLPDEQAHGYLHCTLPQQDTPDFIKYIIDERWGEEEPDLFYYRLLSKSGKFFYRRDPYQQHSVPEVVTIPFEPIKISNDAGNNLQYFEIYDDDGTYYRFGKPRITDDGGFAGANTTRNQWKVSEIVTPVRRDTVYFRYGLSKEFTTHEEVDYILVEDITHNGYHVMTHNPLSVEYPETENEPHVCHVSWPYLIKGSASSPNYDCVRLLRKELDPNSPVGYRLVEQDETYDLGTYFSRPSGRSFITENYVSTIESPNVRVLFEEVNHELTNIKIIDKISGAQIKTIRFRQTLYRNNDNGSIQKKKLDRVEILDRNNTVVETYLFTYNDTNSVPFYGNQNVDHWGYYTFAGGAVPQRTIQVYCPDGDINNTQRPYDFVIGEGSKSAGSDAALSVGILKSITYPTGRRSVFTFESNTYVDGNTIKRGGGLRIARIEEYESGKMTPSLIKKYEYGRTGSGEGSIKKTPDPDEYLYELKTHILVPHAQPASGPPTIQTYLRASARSRMYTSTSLCGAAYDNGSHVFYDYITEYRLDQNGQATSGKMVYEYSHPDTRGFYYVPGTYLSFNGTGEWHGGKLICKTDYKYASQGSFEPHVKNTYSYDIYKTGDYVFNKYFVKKHFVGPWDDVDYDKQLLLQGPDGFDKHQTFFVLGCERLTSETTTLYEGSDSLSTTRTYAYQDDNHMYVTQTTQADSEGRDIVSQTKYPQDISYTNGSVEEAARTELINRNMLNTPLQQETARAGVTQRSKTMYKIENGKVLPATILTNTGQNGTDEERVKILQYDSYGNPVRIYKDGVETIFLWGYGGRFVIARIDGVEFSRLPSTLNITRINEIAARSIPSSADLSLIAGLRTNSSLPYAQVTTYTYDNIRGMTSATDPQGIQTGYEYDSFDRLKEVYVMEGNWKRILETYEYHYETE